MNVSERKEIMPHVFLTCVRTHKFKTGCMSVSLLTQLSKDTASKNALLPRVLRRGTVSHPNMESLAAALDELYGARVDPVIRKRGEVLAVGFFADFVDDDFVPGSGNILEKTADILGEMLLSPCTFDGQLLAEYVDSERDNLIDEIRAEINNKRSYAMSRLIEQMCSKEAFGVRRLGTESTAKKITAAGLTKHYRSLISSSPVEIIYVGSAEEKRVELALRHALSTLPRGNVKTDIGSEILFDRPADKVRYVTDHLDVTQGKLAIGFRLGKVMREPNYAALIMFNAVFGGCVTSKLFMNVREKLSLCYYASSMVEKNKGLLLVSSGIEFSNHEKALSEIRAQLEAIKNGDVSDYEMDSAKKTVMTAFLAVMDQQGSIESYFFDRNINRLEYMPDEMAALADCVTKEDICAIAGSVIEDTVYFLAGKEEKEDEN